MRSFSSMVATLVLLAGSALPGFGSPASELASSPPPGAAGPLVLIGGGADQPDIEDAIVRLAGGKQAHLVIVPTASSTPQQSGKAYRQDFRDRGVADVTVLVPVGEPGPAEFAVMQRATGFFFTGGDQEQIMKAMGSAAWRAALRGAWLRGAVMAGTSAGAMVWGTHALDGGESLETLWHGEQGADASHFIAGFGFASHLLVDTHFSQRGRFGRLLYATEKFAPDLGVGVDPQTAVILDREGHVKVVGRGTVTLVRPMRQDLALPLSAPDVRVRLLAPGEEMDLAGDRVFNPERSPIQP